MSLLTYKVIPAHKHYQLCCKMKKNERKIVELVTKTKPRNFRLVNKLQDATGVVREFIGGMYVLGSEAAAVMQDKLISHSTLPAKVGG